MTSPLTRHARLHQALTGQAAQQVWRMLLMALIAAVACLALTPRPPESIDLGWDKLNHLAAFTSLAFTASMAHPDSPRVRLGWLLALVAFGGLIEIGQHFVPGRSGEWPDLLADALGAALGAAVAAAALRAVGSRLPGASRPTS
jgi:VanZ family protein